MANHRPENIRHRVIHFMNKLSDRDTESIAAAELDSIALTLTADTLPPFISAVSETRSTDKTPLRRHSLRLLSLLSHSLPPSCLSPHLPRILSSALRLLRDPDSSVRIALIDTVRSLSSASPPSLLIPSILNPLADALFHEQDLNPQSVAAYSLAAVLDETAPKNGDVSRYIHRLLPRLVKLVKSPVFRAKPALLTLLGSAVVGGGASAVLQVVLDCLLEFLASEHWAARKAAVEALTRLAVAEKDRLAGFKSSCLSSFEARRYDKVKIVRESMNRMMEVWKEIPDGDLNASELQLNSLKENANDVRVPVIQYSSPLRVARSREQCSRSPPPTATSIPSSAKKTVRLSSDLKMNSALLKRMNQAKKNSDWRIEISLLPDQGIDKINGGKHGEQRRADGDDNGRSKLEARRVLFERNCEEKKMDGMKSGIRVMPLQENGSSELSCETGDELIAEQKESDLFLIRMQLVQIEKQQSSLLDLLQNFIGRSQKGINSLEARINSLEATLDEISHDFAVSSAAAPVEVPNGSRASNTCCALLGAEFLSSKFWRRRDCRYDPRFLADVNDLGDRQKFKFANPIAEINPCSRGSLQFGPKGLQEIANGDGGSKHVEGG